jgi:NDP-sugar pyrophosphorylase family protein
MRAIILAGGKGVRLRPYTTLIPKPLVPLGGKVSILEVILLQLRGAGISHVTIAVNHLSHLIMAYFGDGSRWGLKIDYSIEESELSTIGPLTLIEDLPENFIVMNGDILCDLDYGKFFRDHLSAKSQVSVSSFTRNVTIDFGVLKYDERNLLTAFVEKPAYEFQVSMGIYCINHKVIEGLEKGAKYGFDNLMLDCLKFGAPARIVPFGGYWLDIGRPDDYEYADSHFSELVDKLGISLP